MKIINWKLDISKVLYVLIFILVAIGVALMSDTLTPIISMNARNYTSILQDVHNNAYEYSGDLIKLSGYIYRAPDFMSNQFVIARNMKINDTDYHIVGFLCKYEGPEELLDNTWVKAKGIITLGDYHGPMPIIQITSLKQIEEPSNTMVPPPK